jgi:hypothetical protein
MAHTPVVRGAIASKQAADAYLSVSSGVGFLGKVKRPNFWLIKFIVLPCKGGE